MLVLSPWGLGGGYSGPVTLMNRLFGAIAQSGVSVDVLYRDRGEEIRPAWASSATPLLTSADFGRKDQVRWGIRARRYLQRNSARYDAVHLHGFYMANQLAIVGLPRATPVVALPVLDDGDLGRPDAAGDRVKQLLLRMATRRVDLAGALSANISRDFQRLGLAREKVFDLGNPAEQKMFQVGLQRVGVHVPPTVGFVGKVGGFKNPQLVLEAASILASRSRDVRWVFAGPFDSPETESRLRDQVVQLGLQNQVHFTGFINDVADALREMDLFVLPSSNEGLPGALAEAMAAGLPAIVTDVGSMGIHVRRAKSGLVVGADATAVADGVEATLSDQWPTYSANAASYARRHFSPSSIASAYLQATFPHLDREENP